MIDPIGQVEVRVLSPDEWRLWRELRLRALADAPDAFGSTLEREQGHTEEDWRIRMTSGSVVAFVDGVPAAIGSSFPVRDGWQQVVAMWTDPAYRRRGLSILVLDVVVDRALAEGRRVVLDVARGNPAARRAYERYGFTPTGESEPLRDGSAVQTDVMVLPETWTRQA
jgi:RimJ/RimL family protein N-acetyltransferase